MNFIAFDAAYSLYPRATFEERGALSFSKLTDRDFAAVAKYASRGWAIAYTIWPHESTTLKTTYYEDKLRCVKDSLSWVVPLDMEGIEPRPRTSTSSPQFSWDPVSLCSWKLRKLPYDEKMVMTYRLLATWALRYVYLVGDDELFFKSGLATFFAYQEGMEHRKVGSVPEELKADAWSW